ncbi:hypothetical protein TSAR_008397 [Trichomalopsis sarcophagae]|uniref:DUF3719 domain-containing protein n=1 Tax=Trichomalopsis sarcophagae TaxID=543379 RepID=A0A232F922_9HYME|nr:hypothetical protein TSAR_008397 [Trichomalopsis sarcophagae]
MHKKTAKTQRNSSSRMTIRQSYGAAEQHQNRMRSSVSWELDTGESSWSEDLGDVTTRRVLEQWRALESVLYDEENPQVPPGTSLYDECVQWRSQLPHLRIVGTGYENPGLTVGSNHVASSAPLAIRERSEQMNGSANASMNYDNHLSMRMSELSCHTTPNFRQAKEQVLDHIVEFICKELAEIEAEREAEDRLSDNFEEFLKITPAPTCTGKNPLNSNNFYYKIDSVDASASKDRERELQSGRNKLGMVFNERVIVSPVPFVVTSRESFSTLRTTPIQFFRDDHRVPSNDRLGSKHENGKRKFSLTRKTHLVPRVQAPWNTSVLPAIYPKNVRLTPIDTSRLPSSKRRQSKTADSINMRCSRNSLSPISRSVQPNSPRNRNHNLMEQLEIRGSHIVVQAPSFVDKMKTRRKLSQAKRHEDD